jgi:hypothetical protein
LSLIASNVLDWTLRLELKEDGRSGLLDSDATLGTSELTLGTVMVEVGREYYRTTYICWSYFGILSKRLRRSLLYVSTHILHGPFKPFMA